MAVTTCLHHGILSVGDSITNNVFQENLQDTTGFLVDQSRDMFDSSSSCKMTDGWLGDTLVFVSQDYPVTLSAPLPRPFPPLPHPDMFSFSK